MTQQILPCPACGEKDEENVRLELTSEGGYQVTCHECSLTGPFENHTHFAVQAWNALPRRPDEETLKALRILCLAASVAPHNAVVRFSPDFQHEADLVQPAIARIKAAFELE